MAHPLPKGVESYIVRIYRQPDDRSREMAGLVEKVGTPDKMPFRNQEELWQILQNKPAKKSRKQGG
jgi:hypothetical protein